MSTVKISELQIHPKNSYYFDDISGEKWEEFLKSIKEKGVRSSIIVTDDMKVVSGNQRVRACKELGISVINAEIKHYACEEDEICDLIEINIRQRGAIDDSEIKRGRRLKFLQEYYGVSHGGDRRSESRPNNSVLKTQESIASDLGISVDTMQNAIKLSEMIPEMQELLENGAVTKTTALSIVKKLSPEEQRQLAEQIFGKNKVSSSEVNKYIEKIKAVKAENEKLRSVLSESESRNIVEKEALKKKLEEAENKKPERVEVFPEDYEQTKKEFEDYKKDYQRLVDEKKEAVSESLQLKKKIKELETREGIHDMQMRLERESQYLETQITSFIRNAGGYVWITEKLNDLPEDKRMAVIGAIKNINAWSQQMLLNIGGSINGKSIRDKPDP